MSAAANIPGSLSEDAPGLAHPPGSLLEGAGSPSGETEGVSYQLCGAVGSGKETPPVSFADSPLNEGAWGVPGFVHPSGSLREGAGSPPGETEGVSCVLCSAEGSGGELPQSASLTALFNEGAGVASLRVVYSGFLGQFH